MASNQPEFFFCGSGSMDMAPFPHKGKQTKRLQFYPENYLIRDINGGQNNYFLIETTLILRACTVV